MLWSLNLVLKATVRGCPRLSRPTHNRALWHQLEPTSTKATIAHFSPPGPAGPAVHKHFHPLRAGPRRMITHMRGLVTPRPWFRRTSAVYSRAQPAGGRLLMGTPRTGVRDAGEASGPPRQPQRVVDRWSERGADPPGGSRCLLLRDGDRVREGVARRHGCWRSRVWMGGDLPAEAAEFAGDRDGNDAVGLVACVFELSPAGVQAALRAPCDVDDLWWLVTLSAFKLETDPGLAAVVVGGLDQQPAGVG